MTWLCFLPCAVKNAHVHKQISGTCKKFGSCVFVCVANFCLIYTLSLTFCGLDITILTMGTEVPPPLNRTDERNTPEYLAQLLKDKKQIQAFPNVFIHLERILDEGECTKKLCEFENTCSYLTFFFLKFLYSRIDCLSNGIIMHKNNNPSLTCTEKPTWVSYNKSTNVVDVLPHGEWVINSRIPQFTHSKSNPIVVMWFDLTVISSSVGSFQFILLGFYLYHYNVKVRPVSTVNFFQWNWDYSLSF